MEWSMLYSGHFAMLQGVKSGFQNSTFLFICWEINLVSKCVWKCIDMIEILHDLLYDEGVPVNALHVVI